MAHDTLFVGLDVHKDSITAACAGTDPAALPVDLGTFGSQQYAIDRLIKKLAGRGHLRFVYEAGPCGFWLQRHLRSVGQQCLVAAPSLIPREQPASALCRSASRAARAPRVRTGSPDGTQ
jgi:transposase